MGFGITFRYRRPVEARRQAIAETSAFLSWALSTDQQLPRIPRRRVDRGGFSDLASRPGSGPLIEYWWTKALDRVRDR